MRQIYELKRRGFYRRRVSLLLRKMFEIRLASSTSRRNTTNVPAGWMKSISGQGLDAAPGTNKEITIPSWFCYRSHGKVANDKVPRGDDRIDT